MKLLFLQQTAGQKKNISGLLRKNAGLNVRCVSMRPHACRHARANAGEESKIIVRGLSQNFVDNMNNFVQTRGKSI